VVVAGGAIDGGGGGGGGGGGEGAIVTHGNENQIDEFDLHDIAPLSYDSW